MVESLQMAGSKWKLAEDDLQQRSESFQRDMAVGRKIMASEVQLGRKNSYDSLALAQKNAEIAKTQYLETLTTSKGSIPEIP